MQRGPSDAAVNFATYRILQRHREVSLPQHSFLVGLYLQMALNYLSKMIGPKYYSTTVVERTSQVAYLTQTSTSYNQSLLSSLFTAKVAQ